MKHKGYELKSVNRRIQLLLKKIAQAKWEMESESGRSEAGNGTKMIIPGSEVTPTTATILLVMLDIEERMRMLHDRKDHSQLKGQLITIMRHELDMMSREWGYFWEENDDHIPKMMWESKDCLWLWKTELVHRGRCWHLLLRIQDFMKQIYSLDIQSEQNLHTRGDTEQLSKMLQERLKQWINRFDFLKQQYLYLHNMLKFWPKQPQVRKHCYRSKIVAWTEWYKWKYQYCTCIGPLEFDVI